MNLEKLLKKHENDYVCFDTYYFRKIALGRDLLKSLDDVWTQEIPAEINEDGADDYDVYVFVK